MSFNRLGMQLCRQAQRHLGTSATLPSRSVTGAQVHPGYKKIKETYLQFQIDDGTPIHLKGGALDKALYYTTVTMCMLGFFGCMEYYYSAAFPKKSKC